MKQQRWWPKRVEKHKDHIQVAPVESFSHPCAVISNNTMAPRQRVQTQLWEPHGCTYISLTKLPEVTPFGKVENHHSHCCILRPAEGPPGAALQEEGWQDLEKVHPKGGAAWQERLDAMARQNKTTNETLTDPLQKFISAAPGSWVTAPKVVPTENLPQVRYQAKTSPRCWRSK